MAVIVIPEDGSGVSNANSYVTVAECDAYHEATLRATDWTGASAGDKDIAVVQATRLLDQQFKWNGVKSFSAQALQWPRREVIDPDRESLVYPTRYFSQQAYVPSNEIMPWLKNAVCEFARKILASDRTKDPDGEGIKEFVLTDVLEVVFDQTTKQPVIPRHIWTELTKYGRIIGGGSAKLVRV